MLVLLFPREGRTALMELVSQYLTSSLRYRLSCVLVLWKQEGVWATPEMASLIEEVGITRHSFDNRCRTILSNGFEMYTEEEQAGAVLAFIIYCIDHQDFDSIYQIVEHDEDHFKEHL